MAYDPTGRNVPKAYDPTGRNVPTGVPRKPKQDVIPAKPKPKPRPPVVPWSDMKQDTRAAELRNKGVGRIGDTPLADAGVMRSFNYDLDTGKKLNKPKSYVMGLEPNAFNASAPGPRFNKNMRNRNDLNSPTRLIRANRVLYAKSLPENVAARKSATKNALALAKARRLGGK